MTISAYPLTWPQQFPRAKYREAGRFKTSITAALKNVQDSLRLFASDSGKKLENLVISSNVTLGAQKPADPGVAVWFTWDGLGICIAVDRYTSVESNLQAIHHIIEARRVELRHGTLALVRATFTGFKALPAPAGKQWFDILGVPPSATRDEINAAYRRKASECHPDRGGSAEAMAAVNKARDDGLRAAA
jgi:DnaJ domain